MNSKIGLLAGLAGVQLLIIAFVWFGGGVSSDEAELLLDFDDAAIASIAISDGDASVALVKANDGWTVGDIPADDTKISNVLEKMGALGAAWPVATTSSGAERFEVTEDNYQRRVSLSDGTDTLAELYLGTSPGYQRVHARSADSDDVFSVELSNYELGVNVDAWMDKGLLSAGDEPSEVRVSVTESEGLEARDATLGRTDEGWLINDSAADQDAAQTYANRFKTIRVLGIAEQAETPVATISIKDDLGELELKLSRKDAESSDYVIESSRQSGTYRVSTYIAEQMMMTDEDFLPEVLNSGDDTQVIDDAAEEAVEPVLESEVEAES